MKFSSFKYRISGNLGDQIQTLAAMQYFDHIDKFFYRDELALVEEDDNYIIIMNGWFSWSPEKCLPTSKNLVPIFYSFHIADNSSKKFFLSERIIEFFKKHEPIGCRDRKTTELLKEKGVNAFYSKCITLTFPKREKEPKNGKIYIVDAERVPIPEFIKKQAVFISHNISDIHSNDCKLRLAKDILDEYRKNAKLIITTRLHAALPAIAMGIPVIFFGDEKDYRLAILNDLKQKIYHFKKPKNLFSKIIFDILFSIKRILNVYLIDWNPKPLDIEAEKVKIKTKLEEMIKNKIQNN